MCGYDAIAFRQFFVFVLHLCDTSGISDVHVSGMTPSQRGGLAQEKRCKRRRKIYGKKEGPI